MSTRNVNKSIFFAKIEKIIVLITLLNAEIIAAQSTSKNSVNNKNKARLFLGIGTTSTIFLDRKINTLDIKNYPVSYSSEFSYFTGKYQFSLDFQLYRNGFDISKNRSIGSIESIEFKNIQIGIKHLLCNSKSLLLYSGINIGYRFGHGETVLTQFYTGTYKADFTSTNYRSLGYGGSVDCKYVFRSKKIKFWLGSGCSLLYFNEHTNWYPERFNHSSIYIFKNYKPSKYILILFLKFGILI